MALRLGTVGGLTVLAGDRRARSSAGTQQRTVDVVAELVARGDGTHPEVIAGHTDSCEFLVREPPELHRQLAIEAADQQVSLNRLISSRLGA